MRHSNDGAQVLDTLIEFVQGPCEANQVALVNHKFVDVLGKVLSVTTAAHVPWADAQHVRAACGRLSVARPPI